MSEIDDFRSSHGFIRDATVMEMLNQMSRDCERMRALYEELRRQLQSGVPHWIVAVGERTDCQCWTCRCARAGKLVDEI